MNEKSKSSENNPDAKGRERRIAITVDDKRGSGPSNPWLNPAVLSAIVGAVAGLLATLLTIMTGDNQLTRLLAQARGLTKYQVPVGTIIAYGGPIEPERRQQLDDAGWLVCDGALVPAGQKYQALASLVGHLWGPGNNSDRVSLPDLRGVFLRGVDPEGKNDPEYAKRFSYWEPGKIVGASVGSFQLDATRQPSNAFRMTNSGEHSHSIDGPAAKDDGGRADTAFAIGNHPRNERRDFPELTVKGGAHSHVVNAGGDVETRPKNVYVNYIIKY